MAEKINLSECTEYALRGNITLKVYPASLEVISLLAPRLEEFEKLAKTTDMKKQMELFLEIVYALIKDDNDITKEAFKKALSIEAGVKIMQKALGSFGNMITA
jgi:hypothetical protein